MSSINSRRRYTIPTGLRKLLTTEEDDICSWPAVDAFHEPYPTTWIDLATEQTVSKRDTEAPHPLTIRSKEDAPCESLTIPSAFPHHSKEGTRDDTELHLPLPYELIEQIFSYLSVPALDAARFTCRSWWTIIMTTRALLLSATGLEASSNIRRLAAAFDHITHLAATHLHPDSWRLRHQVNVMNLSLPQGKTENAHHSQTILQAATMPSRSNLLAVYSLTSTTDHFFRAPGGTGMLKFYHFSAKGPPVCVGSFSIPYKEGPMEVSALAETESKGCWLFSVRITQHFQPYALISRHGFGRSESPYIIRPIGPEHFRLQDAPIYRSLPQIMAPPTRSNNLVDNEKWRMLACVSLDKVLDVPYIPHESKYGLLWRERMPESGDRQAAGLRVKEYLQGQQSCFIAASIDTGELCVLSEDRDGGHWGDPCDRPNEHHSQVNSSSSICYQHRTVLLSPAAGDMYTNVTASGSMSLNPAKDLIITIAVIWKSQHPPHTTTLYIYELPLSTLTAPTGPSPPQPLQGKRLISLPHPFYGGVHAKSPAALACLPSPNPLLSQKTALLSGMSFSSPATDPAASTTWTPSHPQLFIWGPPRHHLSLSADDDPPSGEITLRTIDLSLGDARALLASTGKLHTGRRPVIDACACRLHDRAWNILLLPPSPSFSSKVPAPESLLDEEERRPTEWVKGFWGGAPVPDRPIHTPDLGRGITQADSDRRVAALERVENWKRARVVGMKRAGLTDGEVQTEWSGAGWTHLGRVGRPRGWEREWRGWEKEMEGQLGPLGDAVPSGEHHAAAAGKPDFRFSMSTTKRSWVPRWLL